ncbi:MAG: hypothetical protein HC789_15495, partial [Microcoleus sp. CSU_2_2]|nr:hypothetical protein [Microcoleus sp. CSU_2_2]
AETGHGIAVSLLRGNRTRQCRFPTRKPDTAVPFPYAETGHGIAVSLRGSPICRDTALPSPPY